MGRYLQDKYVGQYRVLAEFDQSTSDFVRNEDGNIDPSFDDLYIPCQKDGRINYMGQGQLQFYMPHIRKGKIILSTISDADHELFEQLSELVETDEEITFVFRASLLPRLKKYLKPKTSGASISPFSVKNLPKRHYKIPASDLSRYKEIINGYYICDNKIDLAKLSHTTRAFLQSISTAKFDAEQCRKKSRLGTKEYIHSIGKWENYLDFLLQERNS